MTAQDYILSKIKELGKSAPTQDTGKTELEDAILAKVLSKKFRKFQADSGAIERAKRAIHAAVTSNQPIKARMVFGGNKLWRFEEAPEIDWAELFSVIYFTRWLKNIASVYRPGAYLELFSQDISVETLNNVPRSETDQYTRTFKTMLEWLKPQIPENVTFAYRRHFDEFDDPSDYLRELEEAKALILKENQGKLPQLSETQKIATELNVRLRPGQADDPQWRERVELEHQAIFRTKTLNSYFAIPDIISVNAGRFPGLITTGSTKYSTAKFWAGVGVLEKDGEDYHELVLTPRQLETAQFDWEDMAIDGLQSKNFSKIRVLR
jgi:hypothetical protein